MRDRDIKDAKILSLKIEMQITRGMEFYEKAMAGV